MIQRANALLLCLLLVATIGSAQAIGDTWRLAASDTTQPAWFGTTHLERGLAYGMVGGNARVYVVSRTGGNHVYVLDAATGDSLGDLKTNGMTGGTYTLNDVEVSTDGVIYVCNLTLGSLTGADSLFKVYRYTAETDSPTVALSYRSYGNRLGDKFTVIGSTADNSAKILAVSSGKDSLFIFGTTDNGATFAVETKIKFSDGNSGSSAGVYPYNGGYLVNSNGQNPKWYDASGVLGGTISGSIIPTGTNAIRHIKQKNRDVILTYAYGTGVPSVRVVDVTKGLSSARYMFGAASLGSVSNTNGTGDVDAWMNGDTVYFAYLSTNNGLALGYAKPVSYATFTLNTSTVVDTIDAASMVQVRGGNAPLTWGDDSPLMTNTAGDYWTITHMFQDGSVNYKYYADTWEGGGDKTLTLAGDTVLALAYFNQGNTPPYTPTDSIDVWFRVNMLAKTQFDAATDTVFVQGSFNGWGEGNMLHREGTSHFYSGQVKIKDTVGTGGAQNFKFTYNHNGSKTWETISDRAATLLNDTTLYWKWWDNVEYYAGPVDSVDVVFTLNTSTIADTVKSTTKVQIRGSWTGWGDASPNLTNVGGDYWQVTQRLQSGTSLMYKYWVEGAPNTGWETTNDRAFVVGANDSTVPVQYWSSATPPYEETDSIDVWFRVNMQSQENFTPGTDLVHVRGSFNGWSDATPLSREGTTYFYSGQAKMPDTTGYTGSIMYKFTYTKNNATNWETRSDRPATVLNDTTLYWKWWDDNPYSPPAATDTLIVTFRANLARAIAERGFSIGDTIQVRSGFNSTALEVRTKQMARLGVSTIYSAIDTIIGSIGNDLNYQYYLIKGGLDYREVYFDFSYPDPTNAAAERRRLVVSGNTFTVNDTASSQTEPRRMPRFRNTQLLSKNMTVTYTVDIRPAIYAIVAGKKLVATNIAPRVIGNRDSVTIEGVYMNGPAVGGWDILGRWGNKADTVKMVDDGTRGDAVAGDSIFTLTWTYTTGDVVGQEFKFGIGSYDNEGGFGNNHIENIDDSAPTAVIASQFGSIDPIFYDMWDFDNHRPLIGLPTSVEATEAIPDVYSLSQNYPNPFNPSTTIEFGLPIESDVTLKVYNTLGQEVTTIVAGQMRAGMHQITFDASRLATGVYFYQIKAGDFTSLKKMVLVK